MHFQDSEEEVSLYRAAKTVEAALAKAKKNDVRPLKRLRFEQKELVADGIASPSGRRDIEKAYNKYRSVAHLLAADILTFNAFVPKVVFARSFGEDAYVLNTAGKIERLILARQPNSFRNPWLVTPSLPTHLASFGEAPLEGLPIDFLRQGFDHAE